jgi:3-oxoacyl-[acyl-carrier protein] reductase
MMSTADRRVGLVTGGSRGIGRAICIALAREGYAVMINYNENLGAATDTREQIERAGGVADICAGDIGAKSHRDLLVENTLDTFGRIDLLVNNAGIAEPDPQDLLEAREESYNKVMNVNLKGPFFLTRTVAQRMVELLHDKVIERPAIVNVSSIRSFTVGTNRPGYCLSKAGISMMTRLFAVRLAEYGIGVYEICPGVIDTEMIEPQREKYAQALEQGAAPLRRIGRPEEVARAVAAIARGDFPYSTGQVFYVDGGFHLRAL